MEVWKSIPNYEGFYEVSSYGRVRRVDSVVKTGIKYNDTKVWRGRVLKQNRKRNGYFTVDLCKDNIIKTITVHKLVATAFLPKPENANQVNHINCDKADNRVENLEWCSAEENRAHAKANHLYCNKHCVAVECLQTHQVFSSSYTAAEWVNETKYQNAKQIKNMAAKIRSVCLGMQKSAYGYTWRKA